MEVFRAPLREIDQWTEIKNRLDMNMGVEICGCVDSQKAHIIDALSDDYDYCIIITYSEARTREIYDEYHMYDKEVLLYPSKDFIFYQADVHSNRIAIERIKLLRRIVEGGRTTIVTTIDTLLGIQPSIEVFRNNIMRVIKGESLDLSKVSKLLVNIGYERNYQIEDRGQFSIRGGILDIFDLTSDNPIRIELWGDEIDSIRSFDVRSQRSIEELDRINVYPAMEIILSDEQLSEGIRAIEEDVKKQIDIFNKQGKKQEANRIESRISEWKEEVTSYRAISGIDSFINYFYSETGDFLQLFGDRKKIIYLDEPHRIKEHGEVSCREFEENMLSRLEKGYILPKQTKLINHLEIAKAHILRLPHVSLYNLDTGSAWIDTSMKINIRARSVVSYEGSFDGLLKDLRRYKKDGYRVVLISASGTRGARLAEDIAKENMTAYYSTDTSRVPYKGEIMIIKGTVSKGFEYPNLKFVVISENDIFKLATTKKKRRHKHSGEKIKDFSELKVGDYVVHETHGLGIYRGIERIEADKVVKDYMKITYRDGGNLYVLATGLDMILRYASSDVSKPTLNKLGTGEWAKTKARVKSAVDEVASELVELYAIRRTKGGHAYGLDTVWQREFEELFPYEETEGQLKAIEDSKHDMESPIIMDRLICGDVGYGKTEVALRMAFKAVAEGKQVAYLVPTTILAQQHYNTFVQRMKNYPIRIDMMSRFCTKEDMHSTVRDINKGIVDIVIGTHRILSKDMQYKDLGLLIIDEEQRFGVSHKEKIKRIKEDVDVLTLTATPIPRTLHMSLVGIRDMSILEEAPGDRLPIQTYVMEYDEEMVREAIVREIGRGGQVYYVYNRVSNIPEIAASIAKLVPEARVSYGHGQMSERELENVMMEFINGDVDVLVSTTIIETGMDIANVNTIIIHDSDKMGLAQLYQLRGRVGRSNRRAYAFLLYKKDRILKEVAEKRLTAIREFTDLGSGYKIAMRDLEIRGAGNLLGMKQHGHMSAVGYDLYCKMLDEAVSRVKGDERSKWDFNTSIDIDIDSYIPEEYIVNEVQKLDIYKRIVGIESMTELEDMKEELLDRFGQVPKAVENLLKIALLRHKANRLYITDVKVQNNIIRLAIKEDADINAVKIPQFVASWKGMSFNSRGKPYFYYDYSKKASKYSSSEQLLALLEDILESMLILNEVEVVSN